MPRLIDLHGDWLLQYAAETTVFDPRFYPGVAARLGQAEGYLQATAAAVLMGSRAPEDWVGRDDRWKALADLIARIEAEFPGRLLIDGRDLARWIDDLASPESLCWGVVGVDGFESLIRDPADLDHLDGLFERGVRVFRPVVGPEPNALAGESGLTGPGRAFLERLAALGRDRDGPRPVLDLAGMGEAALADALAWFEADGSRREALPTLLSGGLPAVSPDNLTRLRALGGTIGLHVGPPDFETVDALKGAIEATARVPFLGRAGHEGLAIATGFLGLDRTLPELGHAGAVIAWFEANFDPPTASALLFENARTLLGRATGRPAEMADAPPQMT